MKKAVIMLLLFFPAMLAGDAVQLPQRIFVGDPGRLLISLGQEFAGVQAFVLNSPEDMPETTDDLLINRIEMDRRGGNIRLVIDFIPFAPGLIQLPPIELTSQDGSVLTLTGLTVHVTSVLGPSDTTLSEPASGLAMPGTGLLVFGSIFLIILVLFLGIGGSIWGRRNFRDFWERLRRRHLLYNMKKFLRKLRQKTTTDKNESPMFYLNILAAETREFLSLFTGHNCHSLTAGEFLHLPLNPAALHGQEHLCRLFRNWDTMRFSGKSINMQDILFSLDETEGFIAILDMAEKGEREKT